MLVHDPGHVYYLDKLDNDGSEPHRAYLRFVKRIGEKYPGNAPPAHSGTTVQEVLRAIINRVEYLSNQSSCAENDLIKSSLQNALFLLEFRAARKKGILEDFDFTSIEDFLSQPTCPHCLHITCNEPVP